jgi:hypothetical protein
MNVKKKEEEMFQQTEVHMQRPGSDRNILEGMF